MKKDTPPQVELILSPAMQRQTAIDSQTLKKLVAQQVAAMAANCEDGVFEPFFRSRQVAYELRRLQSVPERLKWSVFYERFGCQRCGKSEQPHASNGYCPKCYASIGAALRRIIRELGEEGRR
jgi:hypothetical protein